MPDNKFDAIIIGAGLSGLTAAGLLAKRGLRVAVFDKNYNPGGSCGTFRRNNTTFDQGSAMMYGFGDQGFAPHRFVFNCLEEPIDVLRHELLYRVHFEGQRIDFWADLDQFTAELGRLFPAEIAGVRRFYRDMYRLYRHVMIETPVFTTPDETDPLTGLRGLLRHPLSYLRFLSLLNISAERLLRRYFKDPAILRFFDKMTSTYCYATVAEAPAILAAIMFVDNHVGGSYYPVGSTVFVPGLLEKVIEENGGVLFYEQEVVRILFAGGQPAGVELRSGRQYLADNLVYSGTVWNLFGVRPAAEAPAGRSPAPASTAARPVLRNPAAGPSAVKPDGLLPASVVTPELRRWAENMVPTLPSVVLYARVDRTVIPPDTLPVEMLVGNIHQIDEGEVTAYIFSIDDRTLCDAASHTVVAIGPSLENWQASDPDEYQHRKDRERERLTAILEARFPGFTAGLRYVEIATPRTIERYTMKNGGAVAGPKQMLGQHMFKRLHTRSSWDNLFYCGESTVMGTGTPTVTVSGLTAANAILRKTGREPFVYRPKMKNYVHIVPRPFAADQLLAMVAEPERSIRLAANRCQLCERPSCMQATTLDIRGIMRRVTVGNWTGARRLASLWLADDPQAGSARLATSEKACIQQEWSGQPVAIRQVIGYLLPDLEHV